MVDRLEPFSWKVDGCRVHRCFPSDDGRYVSYSDYAALQAENERLKSVISGARSVVSSWRCVGGAYIRGCCKEVVLGACDDILEHIDAHKGE